MNSGIRMLVMAVVLCCSGNSLHGQDLKALSRSDIWQVRFCLTQEFKTPSAEARMFLEQLSNDADPRVGGQAFAVYSRLFVDLDKNIVRGAFERGNLDLIGIHVLDRAEFQSPEFWRLELGRTTGDALKARAVRALGLCGDRTDVQALAGLMRSDNPYLLAELAVASYRLGDQEQYLTTLERLLALPMKENIYYQTFAVDCLLQTNPDKARPAWERIHKALTETPDVQPNWVYAHVLQGSRLP